MACLSGLTWPGQKVPIGDVISNLESLDSPPKADWWCHPNVTQRWHHHQYCKISDWITSQMGHHSHIPKKIIQYSIKPDDVYKRLTVYAELLQDWMINQGSGLSCCWTSGASDRHLKIGIMFFGYLFSEFWLWCHHHIWRWLLRNGGINSCRTIGNIINSNSVSKCIWIKNISACWVPVQNGSSGQFTKAPAPFPLTAVVVVFG